MSSERPPESEASGSEPTGSPAFPDEVPAAIAGEAPTFRRRDDLVAVSGDVDADELPPGSKVVAELRAERLSLVSGDPDLLDRVRRRHPTTAVYGLGEGGEPFVPTGRVFLRIREGEDIHTYSDLIAEAGYEIESAVAGAPHCAWLVSASGQVADALDRLERLAEIEGLAHAEPQMLRQRQARRGSDPRGSRGRRI